MQRLTFTITIDAPVEKVWDIMLTDATYRQWAGVFMPGSHYEGSWDLGSAIKFLGPDENGKMSGMVSKIVKNRQYEFISINHLGLVSGDEIDTTSPAAKEWNGFENYIFEEDGNKTVLTVQLDANKEYKDYFKEVWPKALAKLKELVEA